MRTVDGAYGRWRVRSIACTRQALPTIENIGIRLSAAKCKVAGKRRYEPAASDLSLTLVLRGREKASTTPTAASTDSIVKAESYVLK